MPLSGFEGHAPGPWETRPRNDGLVNIYAGPHEIALCVRPRDAELVRSAPELLDQNVRLKAALAALLGDYDDATSWTGAKESEAAAEARAVLKEEP